MIPVAVRVVGRRVVVVGGGDVAADKIAALHTEGAQITVVAVDAGERVRAWGTNVVQRPYAGPDDLAGAWLVVAATGVAAVDDAVVRDAESLGIWCVRSGTPGQANAVEGSATFMATVRRGPLLLATAAGAPAVSRHVRERLEVEFGPEYGDLAELVARLRRDPDVRAGLAALPPSQQKARWRSLPFVHILDLLRQGATDAATTLAISCLSSSSD